MIARQNTRIIIADAHVHFHDCFNLSTFLSSALKNFSRDGSQTVDRTSALFLTESAGKNVFQALADAAQDPCSADGWTWQRTQEECSLYAYNSQRQGVFLLAGRQIVTQENLEILALITNRRFEDGCSLESTVQKIWAAGSIPVIPWGVGKWMGQRGALLTEFLATSPFPVFLGDNSGRPVFWRKPPHFKQAQAKGWQILPGTDPLPLASEASRPGSFGFTVSGTLSPEKPGEQMKQILLNPETQPQPYGALESPWRFVRNQMAVRLVI